MSPPTTKSARGNFFPALGRMVAGGTALTATLGAGMGFSHTRDYMPDTSPSAGALRGAALFGIPAALTTYALTSTCKNL